MDADLLRLILLGAGALLVVGIYLWDRYQRTERPMASKSASKLEPSLQESSPEARAHRQTRGARRSEPKDGVDEDSDLLFRDPVSSDEEVARQAFDDPPIVPGADPEGALDFDFNPYDDTDYLHLDPALAEEMPRLILQIGIVSKGDPFTGEQLEQATRKVELTPGDMSIYHRYDRQRSDQALFSMASMLEPGKFPFDGMSGYLTPGLVLFTQLPGVRDGMAIYSDMLFTAERLATLLNADLEDESHSRLTKQSIEHTRGKILEHRRELTLARSRA